MTDLKEATPGDDPVKSIRRMLSKIAELAEQASLTGSLEKGADVARQQYNASLPLLEKWGAIPAGFFPTLPNDASFDAVGVACAQLVSFLGGDDEDARAAHHGPKFIVERNINGADFTAQELNAVRDLLRDHLGKPASNRERGEEG